MHILIVGAGAIGCFFAARLAASGQSVTLAAHPPAAATLRGQGVRLVERDGRILAPEVSVAVGVEGALGRGQSYDLVLIAVKAYHTETVARQLAAHRGAPFLILTPQNGVGNEETLARHLPACPILSAALTTPVEVISPGRVRVARASFRLGLSPGPHGGDVRPLAGTFELAGFKTQVFARYRGLKWSKLLMNILANAQAAILDYTPAQIFAHPRLGELEIVAWREALAVMRAQGIHPVAFAGYPLPWIAPLIERLPLSLLRPLMGAVIGGGRGSKMPSLYYDLHPHPRPPSEVGWLNGAVADVAARVNLSAPVNHTFTQVMERLLDGEYERRDWAGQPRRLLDAVAQAIQAGPSTNP